MGSYYAKSEVIQSIYAIRYTPEIGVNATDKKIIRLNVSFGRATK